MLLLCGTTTLLHAQVGNKWVKHLGGNDVTFSSVTTDANGNVYAAAEKYMNAVHSQSVTEKYDSVGNLVWSHSFTYPVGDFFAPAKVLSDASGNVYVTGNIRLSFGGGLKCIVLYKLDATGTQVWVDTLQSSQGLFYGNYVTDMKFDGSGNIVLAGALSSTNASGYDHMTLAKIDPAGTRLWMNQLGVDYARSAIRNIALDAAGNIFAVGYGGYGPSGERMVVRKYSSGGALLWQDVYDADSTQNVYESGFDIKVDGNGDAYAAGTVANGSHKDYILRKYASNGAVIWSEIISSLPGGGQDEVSKLYVTANGDAYLTGITKVNQNDPEDIFTVKVDSSGVIKWVDMYGDVDPNHADAPVDITGKDNPEMVVVTGWSRRTSYYVDPVTIQYRPDGTRKWLKRFKSVAQGHGAAVVIGNNNNVYVAGRDGTIGVVMRIMDADTFTKINIPGPALYDFSASTGVTMNMGAGTGTGDITVNLLVNKAANTSWAAGTNPPLDISEYRWVVNNGLDALPSTIDLSFDLTALNAILASLNGFVTAHGMDTPANFAIYQRSVDGTGEFTKLATTYANGKLSAQITGLSEFMIASETDTFNHQVINNIKNAGSVFGDINVYPNPARDKVNISFASKVNGPLSIKLYDISGKEVRTIYNGQMTQGTKRVSVDVAGLSAGMYFCKFSSADNTTFVKISVVH